MYKVDKSNEIDRYEVGMTSMYVWRKKERKKKRKKERKKDYFTNKLFNIKKKIYKEMLNAMSGRGKKAS